jgi:hypothetical protein
MEEMNGLGGRTREDAGMTTRLLIPSKGMIISIG